MSKEIKTVDEYINQYEGIKHTWLIKLVDYMRKNHKDIKEEISFSMPTYKFGDYYISFAANKEYFTVHTLYFVKISELKKILPKADFGKGCIRFNYENEEYIEVICKHLTDVITKYSKEKTK